MKRNIKRVSKVIRNRNAGTFSEADFWSFIRSSLRKRSLAWKPIAVVRERAKRPYTGDNKRQKYEYQCNICKGYFANTHIKVDHIIPVGNLRSAADLPHFVESLFCETDNLQCLCKECHDKKSIVDNKNTKNGTKKIK
jgi:5-methylcytosine-specific restriction endonuclease McrA